MKYLLIFIALASGPLSIAPSASAESAVETESTYLIGAPVFALDGTEVGTVSYFRQGRDGGEVTEIYVTSAEALGVGEATVMLPRSSIILLRGAVALEATREQAVAIFRACGAA